MAEYHASVETVTHGGVEDGCFHTRRVDDGKVFVGRVGAFSFYHIQLSGGTVRRICVAPQATAEIRLIGLLEGSAIFLGIAGQDRPFSSGEGNCVIVDGGVEQDIVLDGDGPVELLMVVMGLTEMTDWVAGYQPTLSGFLDQSHGRWLFEDANLSMRMEQTAVIRQALHEKKASDLRRAFLEIKLAEWYVLFFEQAFAVVGRADLARLRPDELERVRQVQDIILGNPAASYTLIGLAHSVGTNEATLKKHFKVVYGTTVFGYLTTCRMERAKVLLVNEKLKVALVAQEVGYKYASHFSAAFRKYYGYLPTKLLR